MTTCRMLTFASTFLISGILCACTRLSNASDPGGAKALPSRTECISKVVLESVNKQDPSIRGFVPQSIKEGIPLAGYTMQENKYLYFQYKYNCGDKDKFTNELMAALNARRVDPLRYRIDRGMVAPSTNTVDISGKYWSK